MTTINKTLLSQIFQRPRVIAGPFFFSALTFQNRPRGSSQATCISQPTHHLGNISYDGGSLMQCPIDGATLVISERSGVEIDYCPTCRGVWLDRGELDKIIERSEAASPPPPPPPQGGHGYDDRGYDNRGYEKKRKSKTSSFLGELFDF
jgi:Zn-finger nucleic acid-binding protein